MSFYGSHAERAKRAKDALNKKKQVATIKKAAKRGAKVSTSMMPKSKKEKVRELMSASARRRK